MEVDWGPDRFRYLRDMEAVRIQQGWENEARLMDTREVQIHDRTPAWVRSYASLSLWNVYTQTSSEELARDINVNSGPTSA